MVIKKYIKKHSLKEKYLPQITLKGSQSSPQISGNSSQFAICHGLIPGLLLHELLSSSEQNANFNHVTMFVRIIIIVTQKSYGIWLFFFHKLFIY